MVFRFVFPVIALFSTCCCYADDRLKVEFGEDGKSVSLSIAANSPKPVEITPELIDDILAFDTAESLSLSRTALSDGQLSKLAGLKNLEVLDLSYTPISDESAKTLAQFENLQVVRLEGTKITDQIVATLVNLPQLSTFYLAKTDISDHGLELLRNHKMLNVLDLSSCNITDEGLRSLGKPPFLQHLWLAKTVRYGEDDKSNLTDGCVDYLLTLETLIDLDIADSKITESGLKRLQDGLKNCKVFNLIPRGGLRRSRG